MKQISLIQFNHISHYAVYMFSDFLDKDYFEILKNKVIELTNEDKMNRETNVKANMTFYRELLEQEVFGKFFELTAAHLNYCLKLRSPHWGNTINYSFTDAWGMQHKKGDFTKTHDHSNHDWAGAFYFRIPEQTEFYFEDFGRKVDLQENMLYLFPAMCKHSVDKQRCETTRVGMAFNIKTEYCTNN